MDNTQLQYIKIQSQYIDKLEQFEKCIIKAAKAAHSLADTAEKKCGRHGQRWIKATWMLCGIQSNSIFLGTDRIGHVFEESRYSV